MGLIVGQYLGEEKARKSLPEEGVMRTLLAILKVLLNRRNQKELVIAANEFREAISTPCETRIGMLASGDVHVVISRLEE